MNVVNLAKPILFVSRIFGLSPYKIPSSNHDFFSKSNIWRAYSAACFMFGATGHLYMFYRWLPEYFLTKDVSILFLYGIDKFLELGSFLIDFPVILVASGKIPQILNQLMNLQSNIVVNKLEFKRNVKWHQWILILSIILTAVIAFTLALESKFGNKEIGRIISDIVVDYNGCVLNFTCVQFIIFVNIFRLFYRGLNNRLRRNVWTVCEMKDLIRIDDELKEVVREINGIFGVINALFFTVAMVEVLYHTRRLVFEKQDLYTIFVFILWMLFYVGFMTVQVYVSSSAHHEVKNKKFVC